jgi:hypothetical protein
MAETESDNPDAPRRSVRRRARRARLLRVASVAASVLMLALIVSTVLVVTGVVEVPGAGSTIRASHAKPGPTTTTRPRDAKAHHRALTAADPMRLWIAGDSLAGSIGPALGELTAATGVVAPQYDSRVSSGLLTPDFFDWPKHAQEQLAALNPEAVVFVIGTNDANVWSPSRDADYRFRTESMMRELVGKNHRTVYWVGPPVAKDAHLEKGVLAVAQIARETAAQVDGVTYVDAHALFDDDNGDYQQSFADEFGRRHVMRAGDGVHFSVDGGDYISRAIFRLLDRDWRLTAQADPTHPQQVKETKGSTQVPGTHRSVSSSSSSDANRSTGTTTTTRAVTTTTSEPSTTTTSTPTASSSTTTTTSGTPPPS